MNYRELTLLYITICHELNIRMSEKDGRTYINNFYCNYGYLILLNDSFFAKNHIQKNEIHFNPLSNNKNKCSYLTIEDAIYKKIENNIINKFENIIKEICKKRKINYYQVINKFSYIFRIVKVPFSRNIIKFIYTVTKDDCKITLEYPLFKFLSKQNKNVIFGVYLEDYELEMFKDAYKLIIDMIDEEFEYTIKIPSSSDLFPDFYIIMKIYLEINEFFKSISYNRYSDIKIKLENLNNFAFDSYSFSDDILERNGEKEYKDYINHLIIQDQDQDQEELKIRQSYQTDWLFTKEDYMIKKEKNNLQIQDEINKKWNKQYWNTYIQKVTSFHASNDAEQYITNIQYMKNNQEYFEILHMQQLVLSIINGENGRLWFDTRIKKYCFRSEYGGKIIENDKKEMTSILNKVMQNNLPKYHTFDTNSFNHIIEVALIEFISDIPKQKLKDELKANKVVKVLLFTSTIPTINGDIFDVSRNEEIFQSETDLLYKRNRFIPTKYLAKRISNHIETNTVERITQPFIISFIKSMVNDDINKTNYIINWLAYYFQKLKKTDIALVLLGEQEVTQILFWNIIIQEIFGKPYCISIIDESDSTLITDIAKDKLFFNIGDINDSASKFTDKIISNTIEELLFRDKVINENNEDIIIHGQILITSSNPAPYLNELLSSCTVININNIDSIKEDLDVEDKMELKRKIKNDLDLFTNYLNNYSVDENLATNYLKTEERLLLKGKATANIDEDDRDKKISDFIQAIKNRDIKYFENVKDTKDNKGNNIYEQLKNTFEKDEGYFVTNDLSLYFNAIYLDYNFKDNTKLLDLLKEKDDMFNQQYLKLIILDKDGNKETLFEKYSSASLGIGSKNLLKINGYKLPDEFTIKAGWFAETNDNSFKKHTYEDIESSKEARQLAKENGHIK